MHGGLAPVSIIFGLVIFAKGKLHPPPFIIRSTIHRAMTHLIFVSKVGKFKGNNLGKLEGGMWLRGVDQLVQWVFYDEKAIWQHFIFHVITLET